MQVKQVKSDRTAWLKGGKARCKVAPAQTQHPYRLVLLGAPGVGKGTQAELLSSQIGACHLSTGDIFRAIKTADACECTPTMAKALDCMARGALVADEIVLGLVSERSGCLRCKGGFLLDGFPRTVAQAEALDKVLAGLKVTLDAVLNYDLPLDQIVSRLSGRRTCSICKAVFHVDTRPPRMQGVCDQCGAALYQREDDRMEAVRVRMDAYQQSTAPLAEYYHRKGILVSIPAVGAPEEILARTLTALKK